MLSGPNSLKKSTISFLRPVSNEATETTVVMPITMPRMVKPGAKLVRRDGAESHSEDFPRADAHSSGHDSARNANHRVETMRHVWPDTIRRRCRLRLKQRWRSVRKGE